MTDERTALLERYGRRIALGWVLAYAALIVTVSLWPGHWHFEPAHVAMKWAELRRSVTLSPRVIRDIHSLRDLATNFLLYVPLGVLLPWAIGPRPRWLVAGALAGPALSVGMELTQVYTNRAPSLWDVAMNGSGHVFAFAIVATVMTRRRLSAALFFGHKGGTPRQTLAAGLRLIYVPLLWFLSLLPLNITVKGALVWAKMRGELPDAGYVWLDPLNPWPVARMTGLLTGALLLVPFGFLSALATPQRGHRNYPLAALGAALVATAIELGQLFVIARSLDVLQIGAGAAGALAGVWLARMWDHADEHEPPGARAFGWGDGLLIAMAFYVLALMVEAWRPFRLVPTSHEALSRLVHAHWIPLKAYVQQSRSLAIFRDAGREAALYVPLGMMLQAYLRRTELPAWLPPRFWLAVSAVGAIGTCLEFGQAMFPDRVVDVTDVMSHVIGGVAGYLVLSALGRERRAPTAA
jgi:glycopeptide antibiotics resistance protein